MLDHCYYNTDCFVDRIIECTKLPILRWLQYYLFLLQCPQRPWPDRQWGLCIFDDIVEHCSPSSFKYAEYFLRPMLQSICDNSPEVRQAAAYGVGVMAQFGGDSYRPFCTGTCVHWSQNCSRFGVLVFFWWCIFSAVEVSFYLSFIRLYLGQLQTF